MNTRLIGAAKKAFTLIEMIAVVAVIAVLAAMLVPRWIKRIDLKVARAERINLVTISNAIVSEVSRGVAIPDESTWASCVAQGSSIPLSKVTSNTRRYSRIYYYENTASPAPTYAQSDHTWEGFANQPQHLRAVVVSILGGAALNSANCPDADGGPLDAASFDHLWNLPENTRPTTGAWANWNGNADDFFVQRINYRPLFHQLVLVNRELSYVPTFAIDGHTAPANTLTRTSGVSHEGHAAYYLHGTTVDLCDAGSTVFTRYLLRQDICFVWENGRWRAEIAGDPEGQNLADVFTRTAQEFLDAARYNSAKGGSQQSIVTTMYNFMLSYTYWGNQSPPFTWSNATTKENVAEYRILGWLADNNGRLDTFSEEIVTR